MAHQNPEPVGYERPEVAAATPIAAEHVEAVVADPYAERRVRMYKIQHGLYLLFGVIEALLVIRLVLKLLGANPASTFVSFLYGVTAPLVAPFVGIFGTVQASGSVLEPHAIVALIVYALLAWLLVKVAVLIFAETRSGVATTTRSTNTRFQ